MLGRATSWFQALNLFSSPLTATNEYELRNERISTRLVILILMISTLVIVTYTGQVRITRLIAVKQPSYTDFQTLSLSCPQSLRCSCNNVAIRHEAFITLQPLFHQLCSSQFISQQWIDHIRSSSSLYLSDDFSYTGGLFFYTLASFCRMANETVANALQTFYSTRFITAQALNEKEFSERVHTVIQTFQSSMELTFYKSFDLLRFWTHTNSLQSGFFSNAVLSINTATFRVTSTFRMYTNDTCNCEITPQCFDPLTLQDRRNNQSNSSSPLTIPGLLKGCFLVEAVRRSTLQCFYQTSCIASIEEFLQAPLVLEDPILPLNSSAESRFNVSSTVDQLLFQAMSEVWQEDVSHAHYFQQCQVSVCTYSKTDRFDILYIIATLLALMGGLTKVLRILIPRVVKSICRRLKPPPPMMDGTLHRTLWSRLREFNYFAKPTLASTGIQINQEIIATRLFCVTLVLSFLVLISYYSVQLTPSFYEVDSPTFEQFIHLRNDQRSNPSFSCPCSTLTLTYKDFLQLNYQLRPVCSSDFVRLQGIFKPISEPIAATDLQSRAPELFDTLALVCKLSADYIETSLRSFNTSSIIMNEALAEDRFILEANAISDRFMSSTKRSFTRNLAVISYMAWANGLTNGKGTNFRFFANLIDNLFFIYSIPNGYVMPGNAAELCVCSVSMECTTTPAIYEYNASYFAELFHIPGFFVGCLPTETIRFSTLTCLTNQSCVDLMSFWLRLPNLTAIDVRGLHNFNAASSLGEIENEVFVNRWNVSASHGAFYYQCRPYLCTYTLVQHNSLWFISTAVFGLIGGLMKILQIVIPRLLQGLFALKFRCRRRHPARNGRVSATISQANSFRSMCLRLWRFNLFISENPTADDEQQVQDQILATRVFLILLIFSLVILTIYSSQMQVTKTVTISNPSIKQYTVLYQNHSDTLSCPCKNIAILQQVFITLLPTFHQVCQSDFVDSRWINGIFSTAINVEVLARDFRYIGSSFFETILSLCQLSDRTIYDGLLDFQSTSFVSVQVTPKDQLILHGQSQMDLFILTSKDAFVTGLQTVRDTTYANALISGFESTGSIELRVVNETISQFKMLSQTYRYSTECVCSKNPTCIAQAAVIDSNSNTVLYVVPGIFIGCYMVEAALQSNLVLLYNQSEIDNFRDVIGFDRYSPVSFNTKALNASRPSQYNMTTLINVMMRKMMTETWSKYVNYSAYYEQCHPIECKYTYIVKYDTIYMITTITGLIGGLVTIFQLLTLRAIKLIRRCWLKRYCCRANRTVPTQ